MDDKTKEKLKNIPITRCTECDSPKSRTNPMARCFECRKRYCFDHIFAGQFKKGMKENDELRDICKKCKDKYGYNVLN